MPQYFDPRPAATSRPRTLEMVLRDIGRTFELTTDRAVFSGDRVDPGTRVLLDHAPAAPATGHLLDLGCGYGPIALALASRSPEAQVWAVDVNERALALCAANAAAHGLANVHACLPDAVPADVRFAAVRSNPPIRVGAEALHAMLLRWLWRLLPTGEAVLVVHKHLGADSLAAWLDGQGLCAIRLRSKQGYRLLGVRRPEAAG